jgi:Ca2+-binding RTX toxin-like protein
VDLGEGNDVCLGGYRFVGGTGTDENVTINGGDGRDLIQLGAGADSLNGGAGNDALAGGSGSDTLVGGEGRDEFDFFGGEDTITYTSRTFRACHLSALVRPTII